MDMTEDVKAGADALHCFQEVGTAMADPAVLVHDATGRDVGDQDVGIFRDSCPFLAHGLAPGQGKGIAGTGIKDRLPGRTVELDSFDNHFFILEIDGILQQFTAKIRSLGQKMIMIAADDYFVAMGQPFEKFIESGHVLDCPAHGHVSGKNQEIGAGNLHLLMEHVGVAKGGDSHGKIEWNNSGLVVCCFGAVCVQSRIGAEKAGKVHFLNKTCSISLDTFCTLYTPLIVFCKCCWSWVEILSENLRPEPPTLDKKQP